MHTYKKVAQTSQAELPLGLVDGRFSECIGVERTSGHTADHLIGRTTLIVLLCPGAAAVVHSLARGPPRSRAHLLSPAIIHLARDGGVVNQGLISRGVGDVLQRMKIFPTSWTASMM